MKTTFATIDDIINKKVACPIDIAIIPNTMGINLCNVEGISWTIQKDNQMISLTLHFLPAPDGNPHYLKKIADLNLTARSTNALHSEGIYLVRDLMKISRFELSRIPALGRKSQQEVVDILASMNLSLS